MVCVTTFILLLATTMCFHTANGLLEGTDAQSLLEERVARLESLQEQCGCRGGLDAGYPVFMASLGDDLPYCTENQHVVFDDVKTNVGGAYNSIHGVFTAPVAGTYLFTTTLFVRTDQAHQVAIVKNGVHDAIAALYFEHEDGIRQKSTTAVTHLDANDEVWMICLRDTTLAGFNPWQVAADLFSHMSGFLINPDPLG